MTHRWPAMDARELALRAWNLSWLVFVWVLLWGTVTWGNILSGLVVALALTVLLPLPRVPVEGRVHVFGVVKIAGRLTADLLVSSLQVAWLSIRPGPPPLSAVLRVPMRLKSDVVLALAVTYLNLVPGSLVVEIDQRRRLLYVHNLEVGSEKAVRAFHTQVDRVERMFRDTFERDTEWHPSPFHGVDEEFHAVASADDDAPAESTGREDGS